MRGDTSICHDAATMVKRTTVLVSYKRAEVQASLDVVSLGHNIKYAVRSFPLNRFIFVPKLADAGHDPSDTQDARALALSFRGG